MQYEAAASAAGPPCLLPASPLLVLSGVAEPSPGCAQRWGCVMGMRKERSGAAGGRVFAPGFPHITAVPGR